MRERETMWSMFVWGQGFRGTGGLSVKGWATVPFRHALAYQAGRMVRGIPEFVEPAIMGVLNLLALMTTLVLWPLLLPASTVWVRRKHREEVERHEKLREPTP